VSSCVRCGCEYAAHKQYRDSTGPEGCCPPTVSFGNAVALPVKLSTPLPGTVFIVNQRDRELLEHYWVRDNQPIGLFTNE
jgi:hypothetical protein